MPRLLFDILSMLLVVDHIKLGLIDLIFRGCLPKSSKRNLAVLCKPVFVLSSVPSHLNPDVWCLGQVAGENEL